MLPKRPRLDPALYVGLKRYFLTFCTARRRRLFAQADVVQLLLEHILQTAQLFDIEVIAYCLMPDPRSVSACSASSALIVVFVSSGFRVFVASLQVVTASGSRR
jgi:hypothetical protein